MSAPKKCIACNGLGYFRCDCWPGDCICGQDEDTCFECEGDGFIYPDEFDDYLDYAAFDEPTSDPKAGA